MEEEKKLIEALVEKKDGKLMAVASTETEDRQGDVIMASGWDLRKFKQNPVLQFAHKYNEPPIGIAKNIKIVGKTLVFEPVFHEFTQLAKEVKAMFESVPAIMRAFSVGFIPTKLNDKDNHIIEKAELLEISAVPVPANAEALIVAAKSFTDKQEKKVCEWVKGEMVCDKEEMEIAIKPYPNEHSCRLRIPGDFKTGSFRRTTRTSDGKKYGVIMGRLKGETTMTEQGYRYPKDIWTASLAKSHCKAHKGIKFEPAIEKAEEKQTFNCECLDCGHKIETEEHCKDIKCPECGGEMRRAERPGPGKKEIKMRWNKALSKSFDVAESENGTTSFEYDMFGKFLDCKIGKIYQNSYLIPSPLLGTYLASIKEVSSRFELCDIRSFDWKGQEQPPVYEVMKLNSKKSDDFLIEGTLLYKVEGVNKLMIKFEPTWFGLNVSLITTTEEKTWNKELFTEVHNWVNENNFLKGEKFALSGEFLEKASGENWDSLIFDEKIKKIVMRPFNMMEKKEIASRGMMFVGKPGTGKTKTGRVLMNEIDTTFIWVSSRDFKKVKPIEALSLAFKLARDLSPTILFIEDIDTWLHEYTIDLLKTELDGLRQNKGVITILTSNTPERLPDTLLDRPGRFHDVIDFVLPDVKERNKMLELWAGNIEKQYQQEILDKTMGFSGAHMKELVDFAKVIAEENEISVGKALLMGIDKILAHKELVERLRQESRETVKEELKKLQKEVCQTKEGRVLSGKNRTLIADAIELFHNAIAALQELLQATEASVKGGEGKSVKGRKEVAQEPRVDRVIVRALQKMSREVNETLYTIKRKK